MLRRNLAYIWRRHQNYKSECIYPVLFRILVKLFYRSQIALLKKNITRSSLLLWISFIHMLHQHYLIIAWLEFSGLEYICCWFSFWSRQHGWQSKWVDDTSWVWLPYVSRSVNNKKLHWMDNEVLKLGKPTFLNTKKKPCLKRVHQYLWYSSGQSWGVYCSKRDHPSFLGNVLWINKQIYHIFRNHGR